MLVKQELQAACKIMGQGSALKMEGKLQREITDPGGGSQKGCSQQYFEEAENCSKCRRFKDPWTKKED